MGQKKAARAGVINWCVAAVPHHSPVLQSLAKDDKSLGKGTKGALERIADVFQWAFTRRAWMYFPVPPCYLLPGTVHAYSIAHSRAKMLYSISMP